MPRAARDRSCAALCRVCAISAAWRRRYNQGVLLSGLAWLHEATANASLLDVAARVANATISLMAQGGPPRDPNTPRRRRVASLRPFTCRAAVGRVAARQAY
jgi:rhamnogalacturonyl hydrolase YesR